MFSAYLVAALLLAGDAKASGDDPAPAEVYKKLTTTQRKAIYRSFKGAPKNAGDPAEFAARSRRVPLEVVNLVVAEMERNNGKTDAEARGEAEPEDAQTKAAKKKRAMQEDYFRRLEYERKNPMREMQENKKYDRFKKLTHFSLLMTIDGGDQVVWTYDVDDSGEPSRLTLGIVSTARTWQYIRDHEASALVDGQPLKLPQENWDGQMLLEGVRETVALFVPGPDRDKIAAAKSFEVRFGRREVTWSRRELERLRDFLIGHAKAVTDRKPPAEAGK